MEGNVNFDPAKDIPSLAGKVIFVTGGTAGLGAESIRAFAAHKPEHIYFTGRNAEAASTFISEIQSKHSFTALTFIKMDQSSLQSIKEAITKNFKHGRVDILMNNAGIVVNPAVLSVDGYEIQFATNHLGHAMVTKQLLPFLLTAAKDGADVRVINLSSDGYASHRMIKGGISFSELDSKGTMSRMLLGGWIRYGHSKLANILFASELARRHPEITSVSVHPGVVMTPMNTEMDVLNRTFVNVTTWLGGVKHLQPHQGVLSQLWCAVAAKGDIRNGGFYRPVGVDNTEKLTKEARDEQLAKKLWEWTENVLEKF